jgi:hypothetical protein
MAIAIRKPDEDQISCPLDASRAEFYAAMEKARGRYGDNQLSAKGTYLGVFRDPDSGRIDFDPTTIVHTRRAVDTLGAHCHSIGGAFDFATGDGVFPPHVKGTSKTALSEEYLKGGMTEDDVHELTLNYYKMHGKMPTEESIEKLRKKIGYGTPNPRRKHIKPTCEGTGQPYPENGVCTECGQDVEPRPDGGTWRHRVANLDLYHGTTMENAKSIAEFGFRHPDVTTLTTNEDLAKSYSASVGGGATLHLSIPDDQVDDWVYESAPGVQGYSMKKVFDLPPEWVDIIPAKTAVTASLSPDRIAQALNSRDGRDLLESITGSYQNDWTYGGCGLAAGAIKRMIGGTIKAIINDRGEVMDRPNYWPMVQHYVVETSPGTYVDAKGSHGSEILRDEEFGAFDQYPNLIIDVTPDVLQHNRGIMMGHEDQIVNFVQDYLSNARTAAAEFKEEDHPRGQPGNAGQFATAPGSKRVEPVVGDTVKKHTAVDLRMHEIPKEKRKLIIDRMTNEVGATPEKALHNVVTQFERTPVDV